jgi:hypothetical protein
MEMTTGIPTGHSPSALGESLWARQQTPTEQRVTARVRKMVEELPSWDPMPPGEIVVRRGGSL